jgi:hypothetical protein
LMDGSMKKEAIIHQARLTEESHSGHGQRDRR